VHFIYEWLPNPVTLIIGANDESVFSHMKMAFWSWTFILPFEYAWFKDTLENKKGFVLARVVSVVALSWLEALVWYVVPAIVKAELPLSIELPWAFATVYMIGLLVGGLERVLQKGQFDRYSTIVILILLALSVFFFTAFTFEKPWIDIFYLVSHILFFLLCKSISRSNGCLHAESHVFERNH